MNRQVLLDKLEEFQTNLKDSRNDIEQKLVKINRNLEDLENTEYEIEQLIKDINKDGIENKSDDE